MAADEEESSNGAMRAVQLVEFGAPGKFELHEVPDPVPGEDEVVVDIRVCGLNRLDLWLEENALPIKPSLPRTTGGEVAGRLAEVGAGVRGWRAGDRVAV